MRASRGAGGASESLKALGFQQLKPETRPFHLDPPERKLSFEFFHQENGLRLFSKEVHFLQLVKLIKNYQIAVPPPGIFSKAEAMDAQKTSHPR